MDMCCCCKSFSRTNVPITPAIKTDKPNSDKKNVRRKSDTRKQSDDKQVPDYVRVLMVTDVTGKKKQMLVPAALDLERPKRPRTTFTENQLALLEREFSESHFLSESKRQKLANSLGLSETQIKVWFQNRRTKYRRAEQRGNDSFTASCFAKSTVPYCPQVLPPVYGMAFSWNPMPSPLFPSGHEISNSDKLN